MEITEPSIRPLRDRPIIANRNRLATRRPVLYAVAFPPFDRPFHDAIPLVSPLRTNREHVGVEGAIVIVEGLLTTMDETGLVNIAPMGPIVDPQQTSFLFRPYTTSATYRNLKARPSAVFHIVDDVLLLAKTALNLNTHEEPPPLRPADHVQGLVLDDACRYFELEAESIDDSRERTEIRMRVRHEETLRPHFGFNRAKHAVIELAILASRVHLLSESEIRTQMTWLSSAVEKTGGDAERDAFALVVGYLEDAWKSR